MASRGDWAGLERGDPLLGVLEIAAAGREKRIRRARKVARSARRQGLSPERRGDVRKYQNEQQPDKPTIHEFSPIDFQKKRGVVSAGFLYTQTG